MDDIASGAVRYLTTFSDVKALIGSFSGSDPITANRGKPWIFKDDILITVETSGAAALVCRHGGGWSVPQPLTTPRFMRLAIDIYVDATRDSGRNITETSGGTRLRANALFNTLHHRLQRTDPESVLWGDLRTVGCELLAEPASWDAVQDGDHCLMGTATYGVLVFGATDGVI